jgi:[ribosomal protein S5]-alanine N-acetyltransferase
MATEAFSTPLVTGLSMILTTKRLVLREFEEEDWPAVLAYQSDPRYLRYYDWMHRTEQDVRVFVRMFMAQGEEGPRTQFQLAMTLAPAGQLIGNGGIRMKTPDTREADIGYELDSRYWGARIWVVVHMRMIALSRL